MSILKIIKSISLFAISLKFLQFVLQPKFKLLNKNQEDRFDWPSRYLSCIVKKLTYI